MQSYKYSGEIKNYIYFCTSVFLRYFSVGVFFVLFNLYISELSMPSYFLGLFLAIGNLSMAVGSMPMGVLIDKYSKKKLMIIGTFMAGILFLLQSIIVHLISLLLISFLYGAAYILMLNITGPFLMKFTLINEKHNLFTVTKSVSVLALTIGSLIGGYLSEFQRFGSNYRTGLIIAAIVYILACIPLAFIREIKHEEEKSISEHSYNRKKEDSIIQYLKKYGIRRGLLPFIVFFALGYTVMLMPYLNLYLKFRFHISPIHIGMFIATIHFSSSIINLFSSKYIKKIGFEKTIYTSFIILIGSYMTLIITSHFVLQIFILIIINIFFNILAPIMLNYILSKTEEENHGKITGVLNTGYNLGDSISTYQGGLLIMNNQYNYIFNITLAFFALSLVCAKMLQNDYVNNKSKN